MIEASSWPAGFYRSSYGAEEGAEGAGGYGNNEKTKKIEIVQGKVFSSNQTYNMSHYSPDLPPIPPPPSTTTTTTTTTGRVSKSSKKSSSSSSKSSWSFNDPEMKRRTRVAKYKIYAVEGKVKSSFKKGYRWIKRKCSRIVHGY